MRLRHLSLLLALLSAPASAEQLFIAKETLTPVGDWNLIYSESQGACIAERTQPEDGAPLARGVHVVLGWLGADRRFMFAFGGPATSLAAKDEVHELKLIMSDGTYAIPMIGFPIGGKMLKLAVLPAGDGLPAALMANDAGLFMKDGVSLARIEFPGVKDVFNSLDACATLFLKTP